MAKINGISTIKDAKGKATKLVIDLTKRNQLIEDIVDMIDVEQRKNEETIPWEDVKKVLHKKHGIIAKK